MFQITTHLISFSGTEDALFPNIPVVFCGVNALNEMLQQKVPLLTGVVEDYDIKATLEVALKLHPQTKEIIAVGNGTPSVLQKSSCLMML
ncbi:MAG: hypothetical protein MZU91_06320 [Desulfosudis oleivorans]|nr:hypothetical protein [Desulfosudis oleivorans]